MTDRVARAIYDEMEGPANNQDFRRQQRQWVLSQKLARAAIQAYEAALAADGYVIVPRATTDAIRQKLEEFDIYDRAAWSFLLDAATDHP